MKLFQTEHMKYVYRYEVEPFFMKYYFDVVALDFFSLSRNDRRDEGKVCIVLYIHTYINDDLLE